MKIISFSQQGPRAICIISAVGLISNVTLRQPNSSGGTLTYEVGFFLVCSTSSDSNLHHIVVVISFLISDSNELGIEVQLCITLGKRRISLVPALVSSITFDE